jgi:hypothetical protein
LADVPGASTTLHWLPDPEDRHVRAAEDYLTLLADGASVALAIAALRSTENVTRKANDVLRASGLPVLPKDDPHVARDLMAAQAGQSLSPVLLVRGEIDRGLPLTIADGYHRLSACYHIDENVEVQCRIVAWSSGPR